MTKNMLDDKVAIVTGASSGIGRATALALAKRGACVALGSRSAAALEGLAREIQDLGRWALAIPTDVTEREQVERLVQEAVSRWGKVDILVANAGQYLRSPIAALNLPILERSMAVNFYGAVYIVLAVLPHMLERRSGHIVLVSSMDAKKGLLPDTPYVAAKFALSGFGEVLRQELYGTGVSVTTLYPGRVDTPMIQGIKVPRISAKLSAETVAEAIVNSVFWPQAEVILPLHARLLYYLNVVSPRLADRAARYFHLEGWEE